ncbi:tetratricopeptide repeat protein [Streptomyces phaeochromogenes]|uniref:tetratricopeptide repeat protein n=1 Tax=Streptomyces phaeochromogenes TaxID=1923 RepID=UPI002E0EAE78|nr:hypothetical protein OG437_41110 [Streptomyces phaeochromogenes]
MPYREPAVGASGPEEGPPQTADELRQAAERAYSSADVDKARRLIVQATDSYRRHHDEWGVADAIAVRGAIARFSGDVDSAIDFYGEALSLFTVVGDLTSTARLYRALAEVRFATGDHLGSAAVLHEGLSLLPDDPVLLEGLGYALWYLGREADALTHLTHAMTVAPNHQSALFARGQIHADLEHPRPALADLDHLTLPEGTPLDRRADLRSARGISLVALGRNEEGEAELSEALRLEPRRARTYGRLAGVRLRAGDLDGAQAALSTALTVPDRLPTAHANRIRQLLDRLSATRA